MNVIRLIRNFKTRCEIRLAFRKEISTLTKLYGLWMKILLKVYWDENSDFKRIVIAASVKNVHRIQSILILCKNGFAKDAIPLLRSIFEELVDLKYMDSNHHKVRDFIDFDIYERLLLWKIDAKKYVNDAYLARKTELDNDWEKIKHRFTWKDKDGKDRVCRRWTCKSVRDVSRLVGLKREYQIIFGYLSHYIHSTTISMNDYILGKDKKGVVTVVGTTTHLVSQVLNTASKLSAEIIKITLKEHNLPLDSELQEISKGLPDI